MDVTVKHHEYTAHIAAWGKYRLTLVGGEKYKDEYLKMYSTREDSVDFSSRKAITYVPAFAKAAIIEIRNAIFSRMADVARIGGSPSYEKAMTENVDRKHSSMNAFIGVSVLMDMLAIEKIGVYVDQPKLVNPTGTKLDDARNPYIYTFAAEQIKSWSYDEDNQLNTLLLEAQVDDKDPDTGLVIGKTKEYRFFKVIAEGVEVTVTDKDGENEETEVMNWKYIPFVIFDITESLLVAVADYQIALLNIASSDVVAAWKNNFAFYTEQQDSRSQRNNLRPVNAEGDSDDGTAAKAGTAGDKEIVVGSTQGRLYGQGMERPGFINPSSEPLEVSMRKQDAMQREIRQLVQLAIANMDPRRESAESKSMDERGLEAGLSYIAQELERGEREIAKIWAMYENTDKVATISYPEDYSLKTVSERIADAKELIDHVKSSPSKTYQKEVSKLSVEWVVGRKVGSETLDKIKKEIDDSSVVFVDPEALILDVETGLATRTTASEIRGYPEGEAEEAKAEHAERAAVIVAAQTADNPAARGMSDLAPDNSGADKEKETSQSRENSADSAKGVRT